jgi:hypothetical protein
MEIENSCLKVKNVNLINIFAGNYQLNIYENQNFEVEVFVSY